MRVSRRILSGYTSIPADDHALRLLFDDVGLEVKRSEKIVLGGLADTAFDLELLANRGDHHCLAGVARELHGRTGLGLCLPPTADLVAGDIGRDVRVETELCLRYTLTPLELEAGAALPQDALLPLEAAGLHSISAAVDATNLSNIELGQPTHIFDADAIVGAVVVRLARPGERAWPLFRAAPVDLPADAVVIADDVKVLAIAGVIGCEESKATATSRRLLLESACFDPVSVRRTARALDLRTDASVRFERGADPDAALVGAGRVVHLLQTHCGATCSGQSAVVGAWVRRDRTIALAPDAARRFLGLPLSADEMAERLRRYGFAVSGDDALLMVAVPPARDWDVEGVADLWEELARSVSYDAVPIELPAVELGALPGPVEQVRTAVDAVLVGMGFYEVYTDGFYGRDLAACLPGAETRVNETHVPVLNALEGNQSLLKNNALLQLLDGAADSLRRKLDDVRLYEWTRTFHPDASAENGLCSERPLLAMLICGPARTATWAERARPADVFLMKGLVEEIGQALGLPLRVAPAMEATDPLLPALHPGRRAVVLLDGAPVGLVGEVHPSLCQRRGMKRQRPIYAELSRAALLGVARPVSFVAPADQPDVTRDLAFTLVDDVPSSAVVAAIQAASPAWLNGVVVTDRFDHERDGVPVRTLTFTLRWSLAAGSRTSDEINGHTLAAVDAVLAALGPRGVVLR
jgi:phenylalanyl-tRNA synthetase beta chain